MTHSSSLATQDAGPATVFLTGLTDELRETIVVCLERRDLIALERQDDQLRLLAASDVLNQTFTTAKEIHDFTGTTD